MPKQLRKTRVELNNAVFSLPDIVAKAEGYFEQEGLDVELVLPEKRKAMLGASGTRASEPTAIQSFLWHEGFEKGEFSVYHACAWGQMRRTQDSCTGGKVITKRAAVSTQAIVVRGDSPCNVPQDLANVEVAVRLGHEARLRNVEESRFDAVCAKFANGRIEIDRYAFSASPVCCVSSLTNPRLDHMKAHLQRPLLQRSGKVHTDFSVAHPHDVTRHGVTAK